MREREREKKKKKEKQNKKSFALGHSYQCDR